MGPKRPKETTLQRKKLRKLVSKQTKPESQPVLEKESNVKDTIRSDIPLEKRVELEETTKLKKSSEQLVRHFELLEEKIHLIANEVSAASNTMHNWRYVFGTMTHKEGQNMVKFDL